MFSSVGLVEKPYVDDHVKNGLSMEMMHVRQCTCVGGITYTIKNDVYRH